MHLSAFPFTYFIAVEKLEILVRAVNKADVVLSFNELADNLLFLFTVVPQKAEIPANNKRVSRLERVKP